MKIIYPDKEIIPVLPLNSPELIKGNGIKTISIFLAGTIDNGESEDWQKKIIDEIKKFEEYNHNCYTTIYNPRRSNWNKDAGIEELEKQIKWEQEHLDKADLILMVLSDNSKSPISLLELGLYATSGKIMVYCTDKFYRFTNVRFTCEKYNIPLILSTKSSDIVESIKELYL